jgi:hypothetical protein
MTTSSTSCYSCSGSRLAGSSASARPSASAAWASSTPPRWCWPRRHGAARTRPSPIPAPPGGVRRAGPNRAREGGHHSRAGRHRAGGAAERRARSPLPDRSPLPTRAARLVSFELRPSLTRCSPPSAIWPRWSGGGNVDAAPLGVVSSWRSLVEPKADLVDGRAYACAPRYGSGPEPR